MIDNMKTQNKKAEAAPASGQHTPGPWTKKGAEVSTPRNDCGFIVAPCSLGFVLRPVDSLDNRRWYFNKRQDAHDHLEYLERQCLKAPMQRWW